MTEIELNAEITLWDYGHCLGFILDLAASGLMVSGIQIGQSASSLSIKSGWCFSWACYIFNSTGWIHSWFHSKILPGSNARWCVENWPLVSRL